MSSPKNPVCWNSSGMGLTTTDPASLCSLCRILGKSQKAKNSTATYLAARHHILSSVHLKCCTYLFHLTNFKIIHLIRSLTLMKCHISSAQYNTMHSLLNGIYIRLPVKIIFYLNLHKRDFKVSALIGIFFFKLFWKIYLSLNEHFLCM
jgi:hypothetical protein